MSTLRIINTPRIVILHCSDTKDYKPDEKDFDKITAAWIDKVHREERAFTQIGYHWFIRRSGLIEPGRSETVVGAHCVGNNTHSIGVCLAGRSLFTLDQFRSVERLYREIYSRWQISWNNWRGHYEFNSGKTCPGISMELMRLMLCNSEFKSGMFKSSPIV